MVSIKKKQKLYKRHFLNGSDAHKQFYKKYANKLTKLKFASKKLYYKNELAESTTNSRKTLDIIKSLRLSKTKSSHRPNKIQVNDAADIVTDPNQIVNFFNQYFCNIGDALASNVPKEENDISYTNFQGWNRGHKARAQGQGHKKIRGQGQGQPFRGQTLSRPRAGMLEAKTKDQGHSRKCSPKKKVLKKVFQAISNL